MSLLQAVEQCEKELKAAKQRELELLAVIENAKLALSDGHELNTSNYSEDEVLDLNYAWVNAFIELDKSSSQALREHDAKVLEEAADWFDEMFYTDTQEAKTLRRMAEERRNNG